MAEEKTLNFVAAECAQPSELLGCLNTFGDDGEIERVAQSDDGLGDGRAVLVAFDVAVLLGPAPENRRLVLETDAVASEGGIAPSLRQVHAQIEDTRVSTKWSWQGPWTRSDSM